MKHLRLSRPTPCAAARLNYRRLSPDSACLIRRLRVVDGCNNIEKISLITSNYKNKFPNRLSFETFGTALLSERKIHHTRFVLKDSKSISKWIKKT